MELWVLFAILAALAQTFRFAVQKVLAGGALTPAAATWARFLWSWPFAALLVLAYGRATGAGWPNLTPAFFVWGMLGGLFQILEDTDSDSGMSAKRIMTLDKPTAMAFDANGDLYITVVGVAEDANSEGQLIQVTSDADSIGL